jgi:Flp pilus assembly protein TadD
MDTVRAVFTTGHTGNWIPLTWLSHALDLELYGAYPGGHHATAVALHAANTVLLFLVLQTTTGALWPSAVAAALFGLHPLRVESVAWISERKDVLSTLFWLLATAAYVGWVRRPSRGRWLAVVAAFGLGLLAKPMLMTLPCTLLLLDLWPLRRLSWATVREKVPLLVLALAIAAVAFTAQRRAGAMELAGLLGPWDRLANAVVSYVRYLEHTFWPVGLSPWYSHPAIEGPPLAGGEVAAAAAVLLAISAMALATVRRLPFLLVGWLWYLGTLLPVIGLVQIGGHGMADRYTYVPLIGIFVAVTWAVAALPIWTVAGARRAGAALTVAILVVLATATWRQTRVWHDTVTLWTATLRVNPRAGVAYYALANKLAAQHRYGEAIAFYRRALALRDDPWRWHVEVAELLQRADRLAAARAHYRKAIARNPEEPVLYNALANVLIREDRLAAARHALEEAIARRPGFAAAHNNLGMVLARQGRLHEAVAAFDAAIAANPALASARANRRVAEQALAAAGEP